MSLAGGKWVLYSLNPSCISVTLLHIGQVNDICLGCLAVGGIFFFHCVPDPSLADGREAPRVITALGILSLCRVCVKISSHLQMLDAHLDIHPFL